MHVHHFDHSGEFLNFAGPWLLASEAEHNLILGLAAKRALAPRPTPASNRSAIDSDLWIALETQGNVVGCAFRTPPWNLGLTHLPMEAHIPLVDGVLEVYTELPGVLGPETEATCFADLWSRRTNQTWRIRQRQRMLVLHHSTPIVSSSTAGTIRPADTLDYSLVTEWMTGFVRETGVGSLSTVSDRVEELLRDRSVYLWIQNDRPRTMLAALGQTPSGIRIGYVYTPPCFRRSGHATAAVARLTEQLIADGRAFCCLFADVANRTSNAIYRQIGYKDHCEFVDIQFSSTS